MLVSFNGAALFQSGEPVKQPWAGLIASGLQWGRSFSERRTGDSAVSIRLHHLPSMGPLFFRAENPATLQWSSAPPHGLQWGRSFSERRTRPAAVTNAKIAAFNGAALFQSGELWRWWWWSSCLVLPSMGPLFFRAENSASLPTQPTPRPPFNGAALFQSGERNIMVAMMVDGCPSMGPLFFRAENTTCGRRWRSGWIAFNGAALFQSGERYPVWVDPLRVVVPSMGPLFFRAENPERPPRGPGSEDLQWGRSFSERRTRRMCGRGSAAWWPSMGPLFFRAENPKLR